MKILVKFLTFVFFPSYVLGLVFLEIEIVHEKRLTDKTILKSELMSKEIIYSEKSLELKMKNGIYFKALPKIIFEENGEKIKYVNIDITVKNTFKKSKKLNRIKTFNIKGKINVLSVEKIKEKGGQVTWIKILPRVE